jgi:hypothetical protein
MITSKFATPEDVARRHAQFADHCAALDRVETFEGRTMKPTELQQYVLDRARILLIESTWTDAVIGEWHDYASLTDPVLHRAIEKFRKRKRR